MAVLRDAGRDGPEFMVGGMAARLSPPCFDMARMKPTRRILHAQPANAADRGEALLIGDEGAAENAAGIGILRAPRIAVTRLARARRDRQRCCQEQHR